jgi:sn-glycerol 3-phosphate transport system substrate-binding protein
MRRTTTRHTTARRTTALGVLAAVTLAACGGEGGSLTQAGNDTTTTTVAPSTLPGETTTTPAPATTVATPLDDLPACPTDALDSADGPVELTFWHGMTGELENSLKDVVQGYNASQDKVRVKLQNQGGYEQAIDKYLQSGQNSRPDLIQAPEYAVRVFADTDSFIPVGACIEAAAYDTTDVLPSALNAYATEGVQWSMPFNMSSPILYFNRSVFEEAGLDPNDPPTSLEEIRDASQAIVDSGAATYGIVFDTSFDAGGGWFLEQWFAKAGEFYADNENGRSAPATQVNFDNPTGLEIGTWLQSMVDDGLAVNVGDNTSGQDTFLKMVDPSEPGAMTIGTSAALGSVLAAIDSGIAGPDFAEEDLGTGQMPGPDGDPTVLVGGASLWIPNDKGDAKAAAAWDFITYAVSADVQSTWAASTGYVPVSSGATDVEPLATTYADDPRFRVAFDQFAATSGDEPTAIGPLLGPQREIRVLTARALATIFNGGDVQEALSTAKADADALLNDYNSRS